MPGIDAGTDASLTEPTSPITPPLPAAKAESRALSAPLAALAALVSGGLLVLAFPPYGLWWLAPVAVGLLAVALTNQRARRGAWLGYLHGAVFFVVLLNWAGMFVGAVWLLLPAFEALFIAAMGAAYAGCSRLIRRWAWAGPLVVATLWIGQEALRSRLPWGGFPWGRLAFAQADSPFLPLASLGGAPLVTFAVALAGGFLAAAAHRALFARTTRWWRPATAAVAATLVVALCGLVVPQTQPTGRTVNVAVIQGNVPRLGLDFNAQRRAVLDNHVNATLELAERVKADPDLQPDMVVWPENASDIDPLRNADAAELIDQAAQAIGAPILVGGLLLEPEPNVSNVGIVWDPVTGPGERYTKRHPVPFAEYIPLRDIARMLTSAVDLQPRDFAAGTEVGALKLGPATVGDVICFEVAYDSLVRDTVTHGAQLLVVQTNNATFGFSAESAQQLAMVRLRAVEHGRSAVMASTSGVSAVVRADGTVLDESELFTQATFVRALPLGDQRTLATTLGVAPEILLGMAGLAALIASVWMRRVSRSGLAPSGRSER